MERCPNCGTSGRQGAKFCTTCGFRFLDENDSAIAGDALTLASDDENESVASEAIAAWPSAPAPIGPLSDGSNLEAEPPVTAVSESTVQTPDDAADFWPEDTPDPWPAPPTEAADDTGAATLPREEVLAMESPTENPDTVANDGRTTEAIAHAQRLLDELRETILSIERESSIDLSGVISDLEVAVTPPGALLPDEVAELREALLTARERPRDVDTIVDLTKRVDAMVSLVIAYDRTIAAIERSLDVLRRS